MKMEARLQHRLEQRLVLSQHIIQSLQLLQVPILDLQQLVTDELLQNPTLETTQESPDDETAAETSAAAEADTATQDKMEVLERIEEEFRETNKPNRSADDQTDRKYEMLQNVEADSRTLREYLSRQITLLELPDDICPVTVRLLDFINDDGYFRFPEVEAVARAFSAALAQQPPALNGTPGAPPPWSAPGWRDAAAASLAGQFPDVAVDQFQRRVLTAMPIADALLHERSSPHLLADALSRALTGEELADLLQTDFADRPRERLLSDIRTAIASIQTLEPRGIGARTMQECLLLQIPEGDPLEREKITFIRHHLENIANNRLPRIARETGLEIEAVKSLIDEIARLNPRPGAAYSGHRNVPIVPDVIVTESDGHYEVTLEDGYVPPIIINKNYQNMLKDKNLSKEEKEFIQRKLESGKRLISAIEHRKSTIYKIARFIVDHQHEFLEKGIEFLKPLKMGDIAATVGVHLSTVSRAIAEKYMQTPRGILPMRFFLATSAQKAQPPFPQKGSFPKEGPFPREGSFPKEGSFPRLLISSAPPSDGAPASDDEAERTEPAGTAPLNGDNQTRQALLTRIDQLIHNENPKQPMSDLELTSILKRDGYDVARRTVAKYREELKIPSSRLRIKY